MHAVSKDLNVPSLSASRIISEISASDSFSPRLAKLQEHSQRSAPRMPEGCRGLAGIAAAEALDAKTGIAIPLPNETTHS